MKKANLIYIDIKNALGRHGVQWGHVQQEMSLEPGQALQKCSVEEGWEFGTESSRSTRGRSGEERSEDIDSRQAGWQVLLQILPSKTEQLNKESVDIEEGRSDGGPEAPKQDKWPITFELGTQRCSVHQLQQSWGKGKAPTAWMLPCLKALPRRGEAGSVQSWREHLSQKTLSFIPITHIKNGKKRPTPENHSGLCLWLLNYRERGEAERTTQNVKHQPVLKPDGWIAMTLMPHLESSCLITPENMDRAALDAPYAAYLGSGMPPAGAIETWSTSTVALPSLYFHDLEGRL